MVSKVGLYLGWLWLIVDLEVPIHGGYPNSWMVYFMENPLKMNDSQVPPFQETSIYNYTIHGVYPYISTIHGVYFCKQDITEKVEPPQPKPRKLGMTQAAALRFRKLVQEIQGTAVPLLIGCLGLWRKTCFFFSVFSGRCFQQLHSNLGMIW